MTALVVLSGAVLTGCTASAQPPETGLPKYGNVDDATALRVLADRAKSLQTLSAACSLTLSRRGGQSVELDGAMAMAPPERLRLRAWKFNQTIFDLTLTDQGLWVLTPDDPSRREKVLPASLSAGRLAREWAMLNGGFFADPGLKVETSVGGLVVSKKLDDGRVIACDVQADTLTPRRYRMFDPEGRERFALSLGEYRVVSGIACPTRLAAASDEGRILVRLKDVELNGELAPQAFTPPRRAEKRS